MVDQLNLIEVVVSAATAKDKLEAAESVLEASLNELSDVNMVQLGISAEETKWIDLQVGHALTQTSLKDFASQFPRLTIASMVGAGMRAHSDEELWKEWLRRTGAPHDVLGDLDVVGDALRACHAATYGLDSPGEMVRAHVGLNAAAVEAIVDSYLDEDEHVPWSLEHFQDHEPQLAQEYIHRIQEFIDYTQDNPEWYANDNEAVLRQFSEIPPQVLGELVRVLAHREDYEREGTPAERIYIRPRIVLAASRRSIRLRLNLPHGVDSADWVLESESGSRRIRHSVDISTTGQPEQDYLIHEPEPAFRVSLPEHEREWSFDLYHPDKPVIFFNAETGRRIARLRRLRPGSEVLAVAPANTRFIGDDGQSVISGVQPEEMYAWAGWQIYTLDLSATSALDVCFDHDEQVLNVQLDMRTKMRFHTPAPIAGLAGPDERPVFPTSPSISVPEGETGQWTRRIYYLDGVTRQDVFGEDLLCETGAETALLGESGDVWIGRFDVHIFHNGRFVANRIYNMAEGISLNFDYESSEYVEFRYPDARPDVAGLTPVSYQLVYTGDKDIAFPDEWAEIAADQIAAPEYLESHEGYGLECSVIPERLTFRIDQVDRAGSWRSFPEAMEAATLNPAGDLVIRLPEPATKAQLTLSDLSNPQAGGRGVELEAITPTRFRLATTTLARFYRDAGTVLLTLNWHPESLVEAVAEGTTKRAISRARAAARKGISASLGLINSRPLLAQASVDDAQITLSTSHSVAALRAWAWALDDMESAPVELDVDAAAMTAPIPEELAEARALVIDAAETGFVVEASLPTLPGANAILVPLAEMDEDVEVDLTSAWASEPLLSRVCAKHVDVAERRRDALRAQPRAALQALATSPLDYSTRVASFISSGIAARGFVLKEQDAPEEYGSFWGSLLLAEGDMLGLARVDQLESSAATKALQHIRSLGGQELEDTLRSGWSVDDTFASINKAERAFLEMYEAALLNGIPPVPQPWASENRRRQALTELYSRRHLISHLDVVPTLVEYVVRWENRFLKKIDSPAVLSMQANQRSEAQDHGDPRSEPWAWVPYISTTLAFLARLRAYDLIGPPKGAETVRAAWAQLAQVAPQLTIYDVLLADATILSAGMGDWLSTPEPEPAVAPVDLDLEALAAAVVGGVEEEAASEPAPEPEEAPEPEPEPEPEVTPLNRVVLDIHRSIVDALVAFLQAEQKGQASAEELMMRLRFVQAMFEQLEQYSFEDIADDLSPYLLAAKTENDPAKIARKLRRYLDKANELISRSW